MKVTYRTNNGRISADLEADSQKALWKELGQFQEVFEESACGKCGSEDLRFSIRRSNYEKDGKTKEADYHELRCNKCKAKLSFSIHDNGLDTMYPNRKNKDGTWRGSNGWVKWNPNTNQEE